MLKFIVNLFSVFIYLCGVATAGQALAISVTHPTPGTIVRQEQELHISLDVGGDSVDFPLLVDIDLCRQVKGEDGTYTYQTSGSVLFLDYLYVGKNDFFTLISPDVSPVDTYVIQVRTYLPSTVTYHTSFEVIEKNSSKYISTLRANASVSHAVVQIGEEVTFEGLANGGEILNQCCGDYRFSWSGPEGFTSTEQKPRVTFMTSGLKKISLTVTNPSDIYTQTVTVSCEVYVIPSEPEGLTITYRDDGGIVTKNTGTRWFVAADPYVTLYKRGSGAVSSPVIGDTVYLTPKQRTTLLKKNLKFR